MKKAYQLIEELMLLANETVARWCQERDIPTIYRVHPPPDEQKLDRFATMCEALGIDFDVDDTRDPKKLGDCSSRSPTTRSRRCSTRCSCGR